MADTTMDAVVATPGGAGWTERRPVPVPDPGPGEVLVRVRAFAVNRGELTLLRARADGWRPGQDFAGEVAALGDGVEGFAAGAPVAGLADWHAWATYVAVPAHRLAHRPDGVGPETAAALPMAGTTALGALCPGGTLLGRSVLVTGASGGVGGFAVQLAALAGARVTAVAAERHAERLRAWGAERVVAEPGGEHDLVLESAGGRSLEQAQSALAADGVLVLLGSSSEEPAPLSFRTLIAKGEPRIEIYASFRHANRAGADLAVLLDLLAAGRLRVELGAVEDWGRLDEVLDAMRDRSIAGKAVLRVP
jgi:NADPH:quinone reductase